ncbi:hypothetical protein WBP07_18790 (plasmid) [Novosphingobium sp. BL-8A]|uniref:hypothetical protein n=1 Tax=Novosphingobium sp. BL-8A TaxID=3127639 RepID=UPI00375649E7
MKCENSTAIGRHIIDIDGCLRATNQPSVSTEDILALGGLPTQNSDVWLEIYGESWLLSPLDRVYLHADTVAFFRTRASAPAGFAFNRAQRTTIALAA